MKFEFLPQVFPHESKMELLLARTDAGKIIGTVTVKNCGKVAEFNRLWVDPIARRKGFGRKIMEYVVMAARTGGCESLTCQVHPDNADALDFYRKLGFFEATRFDDGGVVMTCQL